MWFESFYREVIVMADGEETARVLAERVVLERVRALRIPDEATDEQIAQAVEILRGGKRKALVVQGEAWMEVARVTAQTKVAAVRAYAGEPGTPDAKVGTWRAPTVTAWKDAVVHEAPPAPLVVSRVVE